MAVAQNTYAVNWFKGKELNLVFGLQLSMARVVRKDAWVAFGRKEEGPQAVVFILETSLV